MENCSIESSGETDNANMQVYTPKLARVEYTIFSAAGLTWRRPATTPEATLIKELVHSFIHDVSGRYLLSKATYCDRLILSFTMLQSLMTIEAALRTVLREFDQPDNAALLASLRRVDQEGDIRVTSAANNIIDLANKVIQTLEPAHLALADHLFGKPRLRPLSTRNSPED